MCIERRLRWLISSDREPAASSGELGRQSIVSAADQFARDISVEKLLNERPEYFVFNGSVGALSKLHPLEAKVGPKIQVLL
jgi:nitrite reductase (NO-forming)